MQNQVLISGIKYGAIFGLYFAEYVKNDNLRFLYAITFIVFSLICLLIDFVMRKIRFDVDMIKGFIIVLLVPIIIAYI